MRTFLGVLGASIALFLLLNLIPPPATLTGNPVVEGLPWQVEILPGGQTRVFGLTPGTSTFADAIARFGSGGELAVVTAPGEAGTLELFFSDVTAGAVAGKMVLSADLPADTVAAMRKRAVKADYMQSSTRKATLDDADANAARSALIAAIAFIPAASLDEAVVLQRFGTPAERVRTSETVEHFLYPRLGLDLSLDTEGKELLQYVAPASFDRLRAPLLQPNQPAAQP